MAKTDESKELAVKAQDTALAAFSDQFEEMAGLGGENVSQDDMAIPFIKIAQALSPEVNKRDSAYIPGLEVGDFFNTATKQVWKGEDGFRLVPILFERQYLEWVPRDAGGGFAGRHGPDIIDKCKDDGKGNYFLANGNEIIITGSWFVLVLDDAGNYEQAIISLGKTHLKKSKNLVTLLKGLQVQSSKGPGTYNPPFFYSVIRAVQSPESNDKGNWYSWKFSREAFTKDLPNPVPVLQFALQTHKDITAGNVKIDYSKMADNKDEHSGDTVDGSVNRDPDLDRDIPF